jgi:hypothetical protein
MPISKDRALEDFDRREPQSKKPSDSGAASPFGTLAAPRGGERMSEAIRAARGVNGQLELHGDKVCIKRKGLMGFLTQGLKGDKEIRLSSISSIQFKKASALTNGYIQFAFMGGKEAKGGIFQATKDENSVIFTQKQQAQFEYIKIKIEQLLNAPTAAQAPDDADQIAKFAILRDQGILTPEEFDAKKKQILGL